MLTATNKLIGYFGYRLIAMIDPGNTASVRVAHKLGMHYTAEVMYGGTHPDHVYLWQEYQAPLHVCAHIHVLHTSGVYSMYMLHTIHDTTTRCI